MDVPEGGAVRFHRLFLLCFALVWAEVPTAQTASLLLLMIWASARAYYFAFYVVEKYVDPQYRFSGLISFFRYVLRRKR
ncbi:MAG: hypothetical protein ABFD90_04365 [Phycisphaerales bacterium]